MNQLKKWIGIVFLNIFVFQGNAQEAYNLRHCIETGLKQNYDILIVRNKQEISDQNLSWGSAGYLPKLELNAGYSGTLLETEQHTPAGSSDIYKGVHNQTFQAGLYLNWTLFDGLQIQTDYQRLKELQSQGELNTRMEIENFIAALSSEYYHYIYESSRLNSRQNAVLLSKERLRIVLAQYEIGSASRLELQQAKVDFNADSSQLMKQTEALFASQIHLNELMALDDIETDFKTADSTISVNLIMNKDDIWNLAQTSNSFLLYYQKEKDLSKLDVKSVQSQYYPYLKLNAGYGYTQNIYETGMYDRQKNLGLQYGLTLGINLFDGNNTKRKQRNAKLQMHNSQLQYDQLQLALKAQLANMWKAFTNNRELTLLEKENMGTAIENYDIALERYKLGNLSGLELREAQNSLIEAEERLILSQYNAKLCELSLLQISGQLPQVILGM